MSDAFPRLLHVDGYVVCQRWMPSNPSVVAAFARLVANDPGETLFNNAGVSDDDNDRRRHQCPLEGLLEENAAVREYCEALMAKLREQFGGRLAPRDMVLLWSDARCAAQRAHCDFTRERVEGLSDDEMPLGFVFALQDDTPLDVWPGAIRCFDDPGRELAHRRIVLNAGDTVFFRGDLVHAGAPFDRSNMRIHVYLDHADVDRAENETFFMHEEPWIAERRSGRRSGPSEAH